MSISYSWVDILICISCCLSLVGSSVIILSYVLWEDVRSPLRRLLVFLSITDFLTAGGNLVGVVSESSDAVCEAQSFVTTGTSVASFFWTMSIAIYLYLVISKRHTLALKLIPLFHLVSWGVPLMTVCCAMGFGALGKASDVYGPVGWCWISDPEFIVWPTFAESQHTLLFWQMAAGKCVELFTYIFTSIVYILSKRELDFENYDQRLLLNTSVRATLHDTDMKLVLIPIIFVGVRIWGSVRFLAQSHYMSSLLFLKLMQGAGDSAQGWANCILFCIFTRKIREKFMVCFPHCRRNEDRETANINDYGK